MSATYGVIVGRFQVHDLHEGHLQLLKAVGARHQRVIVFLGCAATTPTKHDPLDYNTRSVMIKSAFPNYIVLPLMDKRTDAQWSAELDARISDVVSFGKVSLYGSRDSFAVHYVGRHSVTQLDFDAPLVASGTAVRNKIMNEVRDSADFRAGIIYGMLNAFDKVFPCVDIAIGFRGPETPENPTGLMFLMGKKSSDEDKIRFVGGYVEKKGSYEEDAVREANEETGTVVTDLSYVGSAAIDDWRYANTPEQIKSVFFLGWVTTMEAKAADDIAETEWVSFADLVSGKNRLVDTHHGLYDLLVPYVQKKFVA